MKKKSSDKPLFITMIVVAVLAIGMLIAWRVTAHKADEMNKCYVISNVTVYGYYDKDESGEDRLNYVYPAEGEEGYHYLADGEEIRYVKDDATLEDAMALDPVCAPILRGAQLLGLKDGVLYFKAAEGETLSVTQPEMYGKVEMKEASVTDIAA